MRKLTRPDLSPETLGALSERTELVASADDPKAKAKSLWGNRTNEAFDEIRGKLWEMASGRSRCVYCEDSLGTDIEHFWPKSTYTERAFRWDNYLLACSYCNSNRKRTLFPLDSNDVPLLIDPSIDEPSEHLRFLPSNGEFDFLTP